MLLAIAGSASALVAQSATAPATAFKFQFGAAKAAAGYTLVSPTAAYSKDAGFGFESGTNLTAVTGDNSDPLQTAAVTAANPFSFSVAVPEGNYRVTVTLGDPKAESTVTVKAETRRLMLEHLHTDAGKFITRTFTVNVRGPKISTGGEVNLDSREMNLTTHEAISRSWDDRLTLSFSDAHPALAALDIKKVDDAVTLFILGDSTVTDQPGNGSWGQMAPRWFKAGVAVANHAESGETLKGFLKERRLDKVLDSIKPGDYVLVEFGTNDSKNHGPQNIYPNQDFAETYAPADTTYKELLRQFVADTRKKGGIPLIASPSARRGEDGTRPASLAAYATAAMEVAKELGVPGINLNAMGLDLNVALGADAGKQFADGTHHVEYGAYLQAKCIVRGIQQSGIPLAQLIVDDFGEFDPKHPTPTPENFVNPPDNARGGGGGRGAGRGGARAGGAATPAAAATPAPAN